MTARWGAVLLVCLGCAGRTTVATPLPVAPAVQAFYDFVDHLDLADPRYRLVVQHGEGTSCYLLLQLAEGAAYKTWGAIVPEHCGTVIDAEIFAHTLGTALGVGALEGPARRMSLAGAARARVVAALSGDDYSRDNKYRQENMRDFLAYARRGGPIAAVAKIWGPPPHDADFLLKHEAFDPDQPLARFLRAEQPQPTDRTMTLAGIPGESTERELARQLSTIFVIDALLNQRDRFSGGNLQAISVREGDRRRVSFVAYDNGDALDQDDPRWIRAYFGLVTRFDRGLVARLTELEAFLAGGRGSFGPFGSAVALRHALDLPRDDEWALFTRNLKLLLAHVAAAGDGRYFED